MNKVTKLTAITLASAMAVPASAADLEVFGAGFDITDNATFESDIVVGANQTIESLTVTLDIRHTWVGDLQAFISNGATTVALFDRPGSPPGFGNSDNLAGIYTFSDAASSVFPENSVGSDIPEGIYFSAEALSAFAGGSTAGTWTLTISDNAGADQGRLNAWSIAFDTTSAVPEPGTWMLMLLGFFAIGASMRRRQDQNISVSFS